MPRSSRMYWEYVAVYGCARSLTAAVVAVTVAVKPHCFSAVIPAVLNWLQMPQASRPLSGCIGRAIARTPSARMTTGRTSDPQRTLSAPSPDLG